MKEEIKKLIKVVLEKLKSEEGLDFEMPEIEVSRPKNEVFGDFSTNVAMALAKELKKNPLDIADKLKIEIENVKPDFIEKVEVAPPGYINFHFSNKYLQDKVAEINRLKSEFGNSKEGNERKVNNEFISANPTGPLHLGNGRGGFLGDAISKVLKKCGYSPSSEYYINDAGEQVIKLGHSVLKDKKAVYAGEYIDDLNKRLANLDDAKKVGQEAAKIIMSEIVKKTITEKMKINFDVWFSEDSLYEEGYVEKAIKFLDSKNLTYEKDGAKWLKTTDFGDDKDRVLIKSSGKKTYFASDCAYVLNKKERDFSKIIEIWGADHHGYISRFRAAGEALGYKKEEMKFIIEQLVRLIKDGKEARMSKRAGNVVYIDELIDKVGLDAVRFFFLMYSSDTHMNFDLGLAEERSEKNPVYYVQYAHARIASILRKSKVDFNEGGDLALLKHKKELSLIRELNIFPELVWELSENFEVHKLPHYAIKLSDKFHSFYNDCLVLDEKNPELTEARLNLVNAVRIVLGEVLRIMGVKAPDSM